jgi:hypothetical protein
VRFGESDLCLTIIWSSTGSTAPRFPLPIAPLTVSRTGEAFGPPAARAGCVNATPPSAAAARKLLLSIAIPPVQSGDYGRAAV